LNRFLWVAALCAILAAPCAALTLISPTEGQVVRENVKIQIPADLVPDDPQTPGFISIYIEEGGANRFVAGIGRREARLSKGVLTFFWNSKASYYDPNRPGKDLYFKDGVYPMTVSIHDEKGKVKDSATVHVSLKNKVARTNPAPGVSLVNKLSFGQSRAYKVHAAADVFESVMGVDMPILGGLGITADFTINESVEDVRPNGDLLMRYRIGDGAFISTMGRKQVLYADMKLKPQLYSLVTRYGTVVNPNLFTKQAKFTMMGVLPVLPNRAVKEGDTWPDQIRIKIEGLTDIVKFDGTASLDSFEWQNGQECAKVISRLTGPLRISLVGGRVLSSGTANAVVTTYFAYKTGKMLGRDIVLDVQASIAAGTADALSAEGAMDENAPPGSAMSGPPPAMSGPYGDDEEPGYGPRPGPPQSPMVRPHGGFSSRTKEPGGKQGKVKIYVSIRLGN